MKAAEKFFKIVDKIAFALAAFTTGGMLFCVFLQVVARTFRFYIAWTTELSQYFFLWTTSFAAYIAARRGKLIGVEMLQRKLPLPVRRVVRFIAWTAGAFFYGTVIYYCAIQLPTLMSQTTPILKWSMGVIYILMMLGLGLLTLYFLYVAIQGLTMKDTKDDVCETEKTVEQLVEEVE